MRSWFSWRWAATWPAWIWPEWTTEATGLPPVPRPSRVTPVTSAAAWKPRGRRSWRYASPPTRQPPTSPLASSPWPALPTGTCAAAGPWHPAGSKGNPRSPRQHEERSGCVRAQLRELDLSSWSLVILPIVLFQPYHPFHRHLPTTGAGCSARGRAVTAWGLARQEG